MTDDPEIRAKILDWQRRYNIEDGDPAMALIDLLEIYGRPIESNGGGAPVSHAPQSLRLEGIDDALVEQIRSQLAPAVERLNFQTEALKQKLDDLKLEGFAEQVAGYHEGIDYCTKKLDVVKRESDSLVVQLGKVANSISPISRAAVAVLMVVSGLVGFILARIWG